MYSLQILLSLATVACAVVLVRYRADINVSTPVAIVLAVLHTLVGVACVKVFAGLESFTNPLDAGMSLFGGIFILPFLYFAGSKLFKRDTAACFDVFGICMVITLMFARINCVIKGCCMGSQIAGTDMHWPTREVEIVFWLALAIVLIVLKERGKSSGRLYLFVMIAYGVFRFVEEFFRQGTDVLGPLHIAHFWALISIFIGSMVLSYVIQKASFRSMGVK